MNTDKELLNLAAKAHGGLVLVDGLGWIHEDEEGNRGAWWNPLEDDGDALRLAVTLRLIVRCYEDIIFVDGGGISVEEHDLADWRTATRRAIVRAAAEIGGKRT